MLNVIIIYVVRKHSASFKELCYLTVQQYMYHNIYAQIYLKEYAIKYFRAY